MHKIFILLLCNFSMYVLTLHGTKASSNELNSLGRTLLKGKIVNFGIAFTGVPNFLLIPYCYVVSLSPSKPTSRHLVLCILRLSSGSTKDNLKSHWPCFSNLQDPALC